MFNYAAQKSVVNIHCRETQTLHWRFASCNMKLHFKTSDIPCFMRTRLDLSAHSTSDNFLHSSCKKQFCCQNTTPSWFALWKCVKKLVVLAFQKKKKSEKLQTHSVHGVGCKLGKMTWQVATNILKLSASFTGAFD